MAEFAQLTDMYPIMIPRLHGINTPILDQALQEGLRTFCFDSEAFREELPPIDLEDDIIDYTLTPSYDCHVKRIANLWLRTATDVTNDYDGTLQDPSLYEFTLPDALRLDLSIEPSSDITDGLVVEVVLVPYPIQSGTDTFSPEFINEWYEGIMYKAFHLLMAMPGERWTNTDLALYYENQYKIRVTDAIAEVSLKNNTILDGFDG